MDLGLSLLIYAVVTWLILPDDHRYLIVASLPVAVLVWLLGQRYWLKRRQNADRDKA